MDNTYNYISEPVEFRQLEGKAIDFRKTFDLRGNGTDEMLQLYLRKANLSDDVEQLPTAQRRAYVYDIIRTNKGPGYWVPPSMQVSSDVFAHPPPAVRPPPVRNTISSYAEKASMSRANSLENLTSAPPAVSSYSSNVMVSSKGSKYEISGPTNFQHIAGDVTRDRTRNAFDLNAGSNDNVLKKYMIEHRIADDDINGMQRQELIKKIVHSNFTWIPTKQDFQPKQTTPKLAYATISHNSEIETSHAPPQPIRHDQKQKAFSNYAALTSRFKDISMEPFESTYTELNNNQQEVCTIVPVQTQQSRPKVPLPPSAVQAANFRGSEAANVRCEPKTSSEIQYATVTPHRKVGTMRVAPPTPPKLSIIPITNNTRNAQPPPPPQSAFIAKPTGIYNRITSTPQLAQSTKPTIVVKSSHKPQAPPTPKIKSPTSIAPISMSTPQAAAGPPPPPPPPPQTTAVPPPPPPPPAGAVPMPPPPPPSGAASASTSAPNKKSEAKISENTGGDRDAFLESIKKGVALKKVDQKAATISGVKPRAEKKPPATDFLSELKLGITLRRVKNPADNPYSDYNGGESQA